MDLDVSLTPATTAAYAEREPWLEAGALSDLGTPVLRFYLGAARAGGAYRLVQQRAAAGQFLAASDSDGVERLRAGLRHRVEFLSEPLAQPTQLGGLMSGELAFASNRKEFNFGVTLFELTAQSEYLEFSCYWARASHGVDGRQRALLAGRRRHLSFQSGRRISRVLGAGSRVAVVLGAVLQSYELDSVNGAREPLRVRWHSDSYIEVPLSERKPVR